MKSYSRSTRHRLHSGASILDRMDGLGITPPAPVAEAAALVAALEDRRRRLPSEDELRRATVEALLADPDVDLRDLALDEYVRDVERFATAQAADRAAEALSNAVLAAADEIIDATRTAVFDPAVKILSEAAKLPAAVSLADTIRSKAPKQAEHLSQAPVAAQQIKMCFSLRDALFRGRTASMPHRAWKNPDAIDWTGHESDTGANRFVHGLRQGGELWLAGYTELEDLALEADRARRAQRRAQFAAA